MFLGCHDEVVCLVFVINNIFQSDTKVLIERIKKILLVDKRYSTNLFYDGFSRCVLIVKVGGDGDCKFPPKFPTFETWDGDVFPLGAHHDIEIHLVDGTQSWRAFHPPVQIILAFMGRFPEADETYSGKDFHSDDEGNLG